MLSLLYAIPSKRGRFQNGAGARLVALHFGHHERNGLELEFVADALDELDLDLPPIEIAVEIEEMDLEQGRTVIDRGPRAEAGDGGKGMALDPRDDRINAVGEPVGGGKRDIRRRDAERAAQTLAGNDLTGNRVVAAEPSRRGGEVSLLERVANGARGPDARVGERGRRTRSALAEMKVPPNDRRADPEPMDENLGDERLRAHRGEGS